MIFRPLPRFDEGLAPARRMLVAVTLLLVALALTACGGRPGPDVLQPLAAAPAVPGARLVTVYVATTREKLAGSVQAYGAGRAATMNYAEYTISMPPGHKAGQIEWPERKADPARHVVTVAERSLSEAEFARAVERQKRSAGGTLLFVHGFNYSFQEALYRMAQMTADAEIVGTPVLFSWPSEASLTGYLADKESVTYSRDQLAGLLDLMTGNGREISVLAHSMGGWLTVEAMRQLRLTGKGRALDAMTVVLAAPDIDVDVFRRQMQVIGPMKRPMTILVSPDDVALKISGRLAGARDRVGMLRVDDPKVQEAAVKANVQVVDVTHISASNVLNHDRFIGLAKLYPRLASAERQDAGRGLRKAGAFIFNAVGATLSSPFNLAGQALSGP